MMPRYTKASLNFCRQGSNRNQITQARKALSSPHTVIESLKLYYIRLFLTQLTVGFIIFAVCGWLRQKSQFVFQILKRIKKLCFYFRLINKIDVRLRGIIKCLCSEQLIFLYAVLRIQSVFEYPCRNQKTPRCRPCRSYRHYCRNQTKLCLCRCHSEFRFTLPLGVYCHTL